ncbi:kinase-like protein [Xylariaceae sp. AK1471]|nr:kinase-like protein [Xylariaceae sp. AK1471]
MPTENSGDSEPQSPTSNGSDLNTKLQEEVTSAKQDQPEETEDDECRYNDMPYHLTDVEDVQKYRKGGHHPVHLDDVLNDRFEVVHKLGSGGFGLVWLCYDTLESKWRAVKILTADHSKQEREGNIYNHLRKRASSQKLAENHLAVPLEEFWLEGPNGCHLCLVFPVLGGPIDTWRRRLEPPDAETGIDAKIFCFQVTKAVRFLHQSGICHGDLKPRNILVTLQGIDGIGKEEMLELLEEPELWEVETRSGDPPAPMAPEYIVQPPQRRWWEKYIAGSIAIIDFGESFLADDPPEDDAWSMLYAAPEVLFKQKNLRGYGSDIWSLAATLYEIRASEALFGGSSLDVIVSRMELFLGGLPEPYRTGRYNLLAPHYGWAQEETKETGFKSGEPLDVLKWNSDPIGWKDNDELLEERKECLDGTGYSDPLSARLGRERQRYAKASPSEESRILVKYRFPREEVLQLTELLRRMLHYDPAKRITIDDVFFHPWIGGYTPSYTIRKLIKSRGVLLCLIVAICAIELTLLTYTLIPRRP